MPDMRPAGMMLLAVRNRAPLWFSMKLQHAPTYHNSWHNKQHLADTAGTLLHTFAAWSAVSHRSVGQNLCLKHSLSLDVFELCKVSQTSALQSEDGVSVSRPMHHIVQEVTAEVQEAAPTAEQLEQYATSHWEVTFLVQGSSDT